MGNLSNQITAIATAVGNLSTLVQTLLSQDIDINKITQQVNQAVANATSNVLQQLKELDVTALQSDVEDAVMSGLSKALLSSGSAHREVEAITSRYIQHGEATLRLRGVQSGCAATKSTTATRNLNLSAGIVFSGRQMLTVNAQNNGTTIHNNPSASAQVCEVYVVDNGSGILDFRTTPFGEVTPEGGWPLYRVTVPAGNTEANDQYLTNVNLTDIRKLEPNYPTILTAEPFVYVTLPYVLPTKNYATILEVVNTDNGWGGDVYVKDKTMNGFKIATAGDCAQWQVRWTVIAKKEVGAL
jgi:hypothetical protein